MASPHVGPHSEEKNLWCEAFLKCSSYKRRPGFLFVALSPGAPFPTRLLVRLRMLLDGNGFISFPTLQ